MLELVGVVGINAGGWGFIGGCGNMISCKILLIHSWVGFSIV